MLNQRFLRYGLGLALTFFVILHVTGHFPVPIIDTLENQAYDFRLGMTLPKKIDKKVVIVDIDEKSMSELGQWPWDRNIMAQIVNNLFDYYQIKVAGFDIVFAEQDEDPSDVILRKMQLSPLAKNEDFLSIYKKHQYTLNRDGQFAQALKNRNTVLGIVFDQLDNSLKKGELPAPIPGFSQEIIDNSAFFEAAGYTANIPILQQNALTAGYFDNPQIDNDGVFRKVPLLQEYDGNIYQSLALAIARASMDNNTLKLDYGMLDKETDYQALEWVYIGNIAIPVDSESGVLVPYIGTQNSLDYLPAVDIYNKQIPRHILKDKIVIFGTSAAGLLDLRTIPLQSAYPGVEVHANIVQGILDQRIMHKPEYILGFEILLLIIIGVTLTLIFPALSPIWSSLAVFIAISVILIINYYAWMDLKFVIPIASHLLLVVLLYLLNMTYGFFVESRGKRQLTHLFGQYVPPELVDEMSKNLTEINLDGEIREMTVLFTDVRGFTTISENMEPKELTQYINAFLTPLTRVIHTNRGTIDKYMGDAIMAFWGAPLTDPQHALHALTAGMEMLEAIKVLNNDFKAQGNPEIRIGVGINTGQMNVGNKGSEFRVDYTVLGDAVNLGSRLEGLTKNYGVDVIVNETTRHEVPEFEYRLLDMVRVKGKDKPVTIYEPIGLVETIDKTVRNSIKKFHHALEMYRAQKWDDAEKAIFALSQQEPDRQIYHIYLDRIAYFRQQPPGEDWDGVFTHTSK
ncbi:MAG: adenylate/guanylate cyclase domain-containing protein [Gammaproteobacteria bacterium]|nr:adenylate/guanylate cyclase domain-containing protein [Gammaproteobacteria bacterium]